MVPLLPALLLALPLHAQVKTHTLREMVELAGPIFIGRVVDVRNGLDEREDIVTYTDFAVEHSVYGVPLPFFSLKQLGGEAEGLVTRLPHMRYFQPGERVLVMFYPVSDLGFTSPVGMSQAVWTVSPDGRVDGLNDRLLNGLESEMSRIGFPVGADRPVTLDSFVGLLQELLREEGKL